MWQDIAVCVIGISVIGYIAYKVYRMLTKPKSSDPCCGCSGCSLKKELIGVWTGLVLGLLIGICLFLKAWSGIKELKEAITDLQ